MALLYYMVYWFPEGVPEKSDFFLVARYSVAVAVDCLNISKERSARKSS